MTGNTSNMACTMTVTSDDEYEEEEILVHVEFDCEVDNSMFSSENTFKLIGVDSERPLMQLGNKVYQGEWRDTVGTAVLLEDDEEKKACQGNMDPLFAKTIENPLKLACCTRKSLIMSRVFVKPKSDKTQEESTPETTTENPAEMSESIENEDSNSTQQMDET